MDTPQQIPAIDPADAAKLANQRSGTINLGPLTLNWNMDKSIPRVIVDATLHGITIGHAVIDNANPVAKLGGNIVIAVAEVDLTADFAHKQLDYSVDVELLGHVYEKTSGILLTW